MCNVYDEMQISHRSILVSTENARISSFVQVSLENSPRVTYVRECVVLFRSEKIKGSETDNVRANIAFVMRKLKVIRGSVAELYRLGSLISYEISCCHAS